MDLRTRITPEFKRQRQRSRTLNSERDRLLQAGFARLEYQDELDERMSHEGQSTRSSLNMQRRGLERIFKLLCDVDTELLAPQAEKDSIQAKTGDPIGTVLYNLTWGPLIGTYFGKIHIPRAEKATREAGNRTDVRNNYLYTEWREQLRKPNAVRTYPVFALFTSIKAAVVLLTERSHALDDDFIIFNDLELRDACIRWKESREWEPTNPERTIAKGCSIPGLLGVAESLMIRYGDFVRAERERVDKDLVSVVDSPLPDDPRGEGLTERYEVPEEIRFENGYQAYLAKEGSAKAIAKKYNLPRDRFFEYLKDRDVISPHGGDRKGKHEA